MQNKMEKLLTLAFDGKPIRVVYLEGEPWFVAVDVYQLLYGRTVGVNAAKILAPDQFQVLLKLSVSDALRPLFEGKQYRLAVLSESGLYQVMSRSDKPQAKPFQDWVTRDVLPSIRKHGGYVMGQEDAKTPQDLLSLVMKFYDSKTADIMKEIAKHEDALKALRADVTAIEFARSQARRFDAMGTH